MLPAFWCTTSYTVKILLSKILEVLANAHTRWWPCACLKRVSGLRRPEKVSSFFGLHSCLRPGAQIWFRHEWRKLVRASFLLHCIDGSSCLRHWNEFFLSCVSGFGLKFSRIELWRKRLQFDSESDLVFNGLIFGFFVRKWPPSLTSYLYGLKSAKTAQLLFDFQDIKIFRCLVWGVFWSVLQKCLYFFAVGFCKIDWYVLGRQYNFPLYAFVSSSLFFLEVVVKLFDYFWKPNSLFCKFCVTCLLMYYFVYCYNSAFKDFRGAC